MMNNFANFFNLSTYRSIDRFINVKEINFVLMNRFYDVRIFIGLVYCSALLPHVGLRADPEQITTTAIWQKLALVGGIILITIATNSLRNI